MPAISCPCCCNFTLETKIQTQMHSVMHVDLFLNSDLVIKCQNIIMSYGFTNG